MLPLTTTVRLRYGAPKAVSSIIVGTLIWYLFVSTLQDSRTIDSKTADLISVYYASSPNPFQAFLALFSHANFMHWFGNMVFLWVFGAPLEDRLGPWKFFGLFLICGMVGLGIETCIFWIRYWGQSDVPTYGCLGSSGAIFGIMGLTMRRFHKAKVSISPFFGMQSFIFKFKVPLVWFVIYMAAKNILALGDNDGIGHLAHLLGFAVGLACASFLHLKKESEEEILEDQAKELFNGGNFLQALERYDRLAVLRPKDGKIRVRRAECLYKTLPRSATVGAGQRKQLLEEVERAMNIFIQSGQDEDAWRVFHEFIPPFQFEDFSEKVQLMMRAWEGRFALKDLRPSNRDERGRALEALRADLGLAISAGNGAETARLAKELLRMTDLREWDLEIVGSSYRALREMGDRGWTDMAERCADKSENLEVVLQALLDLGREWVSTARQVTLATLIKRCVGRLPALDEDQRFRDLLQRLAAA
jgi:membrane associated rhomboid family serine protease